MARWSILAVLVTVVLAQVQAQKYFITCSKYVRVGVDYECDIMLDGTLTSNVTLSAQVTAKTSWDTPTALVTSQRITLTPPISQQKLKLKMDRLSPEAYQVSLNLEGSGGVSFNETKILQMQRKQLSIFIQTDKGIYKPGHTVKVRVVPVNSDLRPYNDTVNIEVIDSKNNKIKSLQNQYNASGVYSFVLPLSTQPNLGDWTIKVDAGRETSSKTFEVAEYVLPKFEVTVECPKYKLFDNTPLKCDVVAKYTFGQPVNGNASVHIDLDYYSSRYYGVKRGMLRKKMELKNGRAEILLEEDEILEMKFEPDYCYPRQFREDTRRCHIDAFRGDGGHYMPSTKIKIMANVTERLTGKTLSGSTSIPIEQNAIKVEFLPVTSGNFKPGQAYLALVKVSQKTGDALDSSFSGMKMKVKAELIGKSEIRYRSGPRSNMDIGTFPVETQNGGVVPVQFTVPSNATSFNLIANVSDPKTKSVQRKYVVAHKYNIKQFESGSNATIQVQMQSESGTVQPGTTERFIIKATKPIPGSYSYTILSKGSVVKTTSMSASSTEIKSEDDQSRYEFTIAFTTDLAQKCSPSARIVLYYVDDNGKLIVDTIDINVEGGIANKVSCTMSKNETKPGEKVDIKLNAAPNSFIGVLAVDQSVLLLAGGANDITQADIMSQLKMYDPSNRYITPYPIFFRADRGKRSSYWCPWCWQPSTGGDDTSEVLNRAGLLVFSDVYIHEKEDEFIPYPRHFDGDAQFEAAGGGAPAPSPSAGRAGPRGPAGPSGERGMVGSSGPPKAAGPPKEVNRVRTEFPEAWIWAGDITSADGEITLPETAPDTITTWVISAFAINYNEGLGVTSEPTELRVFKPFFVSLTLPYSVIYGEEFGLKITVFNYMKSKQDVKITLKNSDKLYKSYGNGLNNAPTNDDLVREVTVPANDGMTVEVFIRPIKLGKIDITVMAQSNFASDAVVRKLLVEPEGKEEVNARTVMVDSKSDSDSTERTLEVEMPRNETYFVPGSEFIKVTAIGDIMGKVLANLGSLVKMPYGCGEQNMINFAPNIFVRQYLDATQQLAQEFKEKTTTYMEAGYQRELNYQRTDGSFSAFGDNDRSGSTWLTAFVIRSFGQARPYIDVDVENIKNAAKFIIRQQNRAQGTFNEPGHTHNSRLVGGSTSNGNVALTAYILIALAQNEDILDTQEYTNARRLAQEYLEAQVEEIRDNSYTLAIVYYTLAMVRSPITPTVKRLLEAKMISEDGTIHWEESEKPKPPVRPGWRRSYYPARSSDVEMTAYAMLGMLTDQTPDVQKGLQIMNWLTKQQNAYGGYSSTQDTVIALQALSRMAAILYQDLNCVGDGIGISVTPITPAGEGQAQSFDAIKKSNALVLQSIELPKDTTSVKVTTNGCGLALFQLQYKYNVKEAEDTDDIDLTVTSLVDNFKQVVVETCAKWLKENDDSGMSVVEVSPLSGYEIITDDLLLTYRNKGLKRVETDQTKLVLYIDQIPKDELCMSVKMEKVNDVSNLQQSQVSVYSYYDNDKKRTNFYLPTALANIQPCDACPTCCNQPEPPREPRPVLDGSAGQVGAAGITSVTLTTLILSLATICVAALM